MSHAISPMLSFAMKTKTLKYQFGSFYTRIQSHAKGAHAKNHLTLKTNLDLQTSPSDLNDAYFSRPANNQLDMGIINK